MVNVFNYMDNFIFVISLNRKIKFTNKAVMNKIKINLKDIIDTPVKDCLYTNGKSINNAEDQFNPTVIKTNTYRVYQSYNESNLTDGNDNTFVWYQTNSGDMSLAGDYVGLDLGKVVPIDNVRFIMGNGDYWSNYDLEYSLDGNEYTKFKSYSQDTSKKVVEEDFNGIQARYVRVKNTKDKQKK